MKCGRCGKNNHIATNQDCVYNIIKKNIPNLIKFSQTPTYYTSSLDYINNNYSGTFCVSNLLVWQENYDAFRSELEHAFFSRHLCILPYVFHNLNIIKDGSSHANYLIFEKNSGNFSRYEPYGSVNKDIDLDIILTEFAIKWRVTYTAPENHCPIIGIQTMYDDNIGLCQTAVLYNLLSKLNPIKYNYNISTLSKGRAKKALYDLLEELLVHIYENLNTNDRVLFLQYGNLNDSQKTILNNKII
jgi:hypothetical protein